MNQISYLIIRLIAVFLILSAASSVLTLPAVIKMAEREANDGYLYLHIFGSLIPFLLGVLLWMYSSLVSYVVYPRKDEQQPSLTDCNIVSAGSFLIGIFLFIGAIPGLFQVSVQFNALPIFYDKGTFQLQFSALLIQLALGIFLMVGQGKVVAIYKKFRSYGT